MAGKKQKITKAAKKPKKAVKKKIAPKKKAVAKKKPAKAKVNKIKALAPKVELAEVAELITHQEWEAEQEPVKETPAIAPTTPAYSHMFHSVKVESKPKAKEHNLPAPINFREKMFIAVGVTVFTLLIGGMWLRVSQGYFQANPMRDDDISQAINVLKIGLEQIQQTKDQIVSQTSAAIETAQAKQDGVEEVNKAYAEEVKKLLEQR